MSDTTKPGPDQPLQGEGNYDATRRYDKAATEFARSGKVDEAARAAQPRDAEEAKEMDQAEATGRSHAKGEDAALRATPPESSTKN